MKAKEYKFKTGEALDNDLNAIGINLAYTKKSLDPNIEETIVAASFEAVNDDDGRVAGLLVDWISAHYLRINAELLYRIVISLDDEEYKFVKIFWYANAQRLQDQDWRFKKLGEVYNGKRVDFMDRLASPGKMKTTKMFLEMKGEDERFRGTCIRVAKNAFSHRPHQIFPADVIAKKHMQFRYRIQMGPSFRADIWALLRRSPALSGYKLAQRAHCTAAIATKVKKDYLVLKRDYSNRA